MARPAAKVLLKHTDTKTTAVCAADTVYAVTYRGQPIQIKTKQDEDADYPGWKFHKSTFVNSGHAFNLAERLNRMFNTTDFAVAKSLGLRQIRE